MFSDYVHELECSYIMFSIALDEALELRRARLLAKSYRAVSMTPGLCTRLTDQLAALLRALGEHARHYGTIPNTAPLDPANFHGSREQRTARMSDLLSRVLLTQRSQFLQKIGTLGEMASDIGKDFQTAVERLASGVSHDPEADWQVADNAHYDINTCLRESIVLLKSFLVVLPEDQTATFQKTVRSQMLVPKPTELTNEGLIRARRMASVEGK